MHGDTHIRHMSKELHSAKNSENNTIYSAQSNYS